MASSLRIGMIGTDTSHSTAFAKYLNDPYVPDRVEGGRITVAFPGGSPDFPMSYSRVDGFAAELRDRYGVSIVDSPEAVAEACDAVLLTFVDGRVHLEQFRKIAPFGKSVFIDKPFAVSTEQARAIIELAETYRIPVFSTSSIRFMDELEPVLAGIGDNRAIFGADVFGPIDLQETQPGLYWYGIHCVDMLYRILGPGCEKVQAFTTDEHEWVTGIWKDGRIGTVRGNRKGYRKYGASIHTSEKTWFVPSGTESSRPSYVALQERIMELFTTGRPAVALSETLEVIRFIEAANESSMTGSTIDL